jgi:AraC-like DNA-binding protein
MKLIQPTGQLFGRILKNIKLSDLELSEGLYNSGIKTPQHSHQWALLCLVLKGSYLESSGSKQYQRNCSTVFFHPPEEPHISNFSDTTVGIFQIEIKPQRLWQMECIASVFRNPINFAGGNEVQLAAKIYREFKWMDEASPVAIEGLTLELLAAAARLNYTTKNHYKTPDWLRNAKDFLHDNFSVNYSLDRIAAEVGVHPKYLATEFRRRYHLTIGEYTRRLRVEHATRELANSEASLVEIALSAGFCSQSHFTRTFKLLTGFTPSEYRKTTVS